jgi:hypothetical protein
MTSVDTELVLVALGAMLSPTTLFLSVLALVVGERPMRTGRRRSTRSRFVRCASEVRCCCGGRSRREAIVSLAPTRVREVRASATKSCGVAP